MSEIRVSRRARGSMLSSLGTLGASQPAAPTEFVGRNKILGTLAAAGASLAAGASAEGGIVVYNPDVNIGYGQSTHFSFNIPSLKNGPLKLLTAEGASTDFIKFNGIGPKAIFKTTGAHSVAAAVAAGKKFSTIGGANGHLSDKNILVAARFTNGDIYGPSFTDKYYAFTFEDSSSETHYGWMYGSLSGIYGSDKYNLLSYAYDTTAGEVIETGQTMSGVPEPSTLVMGAMAALVLGAAGVRRWKKDQEAKTEVV